MAIEDELDEEPSPQRVPRGLNTQPNPALYLLMGIALGFILSLVLSPGNMPWFGTINTYDGNVTHVDKFVSQDLRTNKVVLRVNDTNIAVCSDGDNCLGYQAGDLVKVTCINTDCQATKK